MVCDFISGFGEMGYGIFATAHRGNSGIGAKQCRAGTLEEFGAAQCT